VNDRLSRIETRHNLNPRTLASHYYNAAFVWGTYLLTLCPYDCLCSCHRSPFNHGTVLILEENALANSPSTSLVCQFSVWDSNFAVPLGLPAMACRCNFTCFGHHSVYASKYFNPVSSADLLSNLGCKSFKIVI